MSLTTTITSHPPNPSESTATTIKTNNATTSPNTTTASSSNTHALSPTFTLLLFASASTYCATDTLLLPAPTTLRTLLITLETRFPGIGANILRSCAISINLEYVDFDYGRMVGGGDGGGGVEREADVVVIRAGDEVAVIPPVSAG